MFTNYKYYTDNKSIVVALSSYAGKPVKGVAKCNPDDQFDLDDGKALAAARCNEKVAKLRYERARKQYIALGEALETLEQKMKDAFDYFYDSDKAYQDARNHVKNLESRF